jgi:hypothetical protein
MTSQQAVSLGTATILQACREIDEILVLGYVDREESPARFRTSPTVVALRSGAAYLLAESTMSWRFRLRIADELPVPAGMLEEPSIEAMYAVISMHVFDERDQVRLMEARFAQDADSVDDFIGVEFSFDNSSHLVLDAQNALGMMISTGRRLDDILGDCQPTVRELEWEPPV